MQFPKLKNLSEAKLKKPTFKKWDNFMDWNDENGADYSETEIDGYHVGVIWNNDKVKGLWYQKAGVGSTSEDFAVLRANVANDPVAYSELDPNWPYEN